MLDFAHRFSHQVLSLVHPYLKFCFGPYVCLFDPFLVFLQCKGLPGRVTAKGHSRLPLGGVQDSEDSLGDTRYMCWSKVHEVDMNADLLRPHP